MNKLLLSAIALIALYSCHSPGVEVTEPTNELWVSLDGNQLMKDRCYSCHNTQGTDNMLAPPMFRVKDHYWDEDISENEFVESIVKWVKDPKEETSIMPGARRKFGIMPKQQFDENELRAIAHYIYNNEI